MPELDEALDLVRVNLCLDLGFLLSSSFFFSYFGLRGGDFSSVRQACSGIGPWVRRRMVQKYIGASS